MAREHEDRDSARGTRPTGSAKPARHWCIVCDRPRSFTYHLRHPPQKPPPHPGVCRRCKKEQLKELPPPPAIMIYEVHHYHHTCACIDEQPRASPPPELPLCPPYPECAELPAEERKGGSLSLHQLLESGPPPVKFGMKPGCWSH